jgi:2-polyprenyl-3-methyl-5-hydroxy-6-metoxy-1,4-benzoquinol methylase
MRERSLQLEWMDLGPAYYTEQEYNDCLLQLHYVGKYLGGDRATLNAFEKFCPAVTSILDVGCGGGLFSRQLAKRFDNTHVYGIDTSPQAIAFANQHLEEDPLSNLHFEIPATPELNYPPQHFDVITSTLVCHHLNDAQLVDFLKRSCRIAKKGIILNDLHRHSMAYGGFALIAPLLFRNRMITHDGLLSIKRAFKKQEWITYLKAAQIPLNSCSITWHWAFRWIIWIDTSFKNSHEFNSG